MTMKTIVWILLALSLHLNAEKSEDQLTCRRSNCACYRVDQTKTKTSIFIQKLAGRGRFEKYFKEYAIRCSHEVYHQNLSLSQSLSLRGPNYPDAKVNNELLSFPFIELSYILTEKLSIHCLNFKLENISTANTPLFDYFPKINIGKLRVVESKGCPVPDEPFETLFNILNATNVKRLEFSYSPSNISLSPLVNITRDLFSNLPNLINLNISNNNIGALEPGVFQHLISLKQLLLCNNKINTLDKDIFKNLTSLVDLNINNNLLVNITHDLFSNLRNLTKLDISNNNISALEPDVFQHLIQLKNLVLSNNKITTFDKDLFKNLTFLEYLLIVNNRLVNLSLDLFRNLPNLINLDISNNNISALEPGVFQHLISLKQLLLCNNKINNLDQDIFKNLTSLEYLGIDNNRLFTFTHKLFSNLPNLKYLDISNNNISVLPHGVFDNLTKVYKILANGNTFKEFPGSLFSKTNELETIYLQYQISSRAIPENCFSNLSKLKEVASPLKEVPWDLFRNALNVRAIFLSGHKQLVSLPEKLFSDCKYLYELDISDNGFEILHKKLFLYSKSLTVLNLSRNRFKYLDSSLISKINPMHMNLSHNKLVDIGDLYGKTNLKSIDLCNNFLTDKDRLAGLQYCLGMQEINLSNNSISHIPIDWISNMNELKTIDLKFNNITSIPDYLLLSTVSINVTFDLSYNQIEIVEFTSIPAVRSKYDSNTRIIILNGNPIACNSSNYDLFRFMKDMMMPLETDKSTAIKFETNNINTCKPSNMSINSVDTTDLTYDTIAGCPSSCQCSYSPHNDQTTVNCTSAKLTHMPQNLNIRLEDMRAIPWDLRKKNRTIQLILRNNSIQDTTGINALVTVLDLSFNNIKDSKHILQHLPHLETLNLSHNHLESLSQVFIKSLSSSHISSLFISGNKWKCDCNITDLYNFLYLNKKELVKDSEEIICDDTRRLYKMNTEDFCPKLTKTNVFPSIAIGSIGVLFGLLVICFYKYQHEIKVWMFAHQILLCWVSEEDIDSDKRYDAFVSYNEEDYGFVVKTLIPELEKSFRICHHERDFVPGEFITEQIYEKVSQSRRTIIVLTEHFLNSRWCDLEFRTAHAQAMKDNCGRVIILIYGDMPPQEAMPEKMKIYMSMNTYIKWGEKWFWDRLKYALPHPPAILSHDFHMTLAQSNPTQVCSATSSSHTKP